MAVKRMVASSICNSARVAALSSDSARLLFTWLITTADNLGRQRGEPFQVKASVFPRTPATEKQITVWLKELAEVGLIHWYTYQDQRFIEIHRWSDFQRLSGNMAQSSDLPDRMNGVCTAYVHCTNGVHTPYVRRTLARAEGEGEFESEKEIETVNEVDRVEAASLREWNQAFDSDFWPPYPRKVSKEPARIAWAKLFDPKKDLEHHERLLGCIVAGIDWYVANEWSERPDDKIPHAATWLNEHRWRDKYDEEAPAGRDAS